MLIIVIGICDMVAIYSSIYSPNSPLIIKIMYIHLGVFNKLYPWETGKISFKTIYKCPTARPANSCNILYPVKK